MEGPGEGVEGLLRVEMVIGLQKSNDWVASSLIAILHKVSNENALDSNALASKWLKFLAL